MVPVVFCWLSILRIRLPALALKSRIELIALFLLMVGFSIYVFANPAHAVSSLLQMPTVIVCAADLRRRAHAAALGGGAVRGNAMTCTWFASMRMGPFDSPDVFVRTGGVQMFLASIGVISFALSVSTTEKNIVLARLSEAEYRYRSFVELSAEAVWRVELERGMPIALPLEEQVAWLRTHARIMETSRSYEQLDPRAAVAGALPWQREVPWSVAYEDNLGQASRQEYSIDGLRFSVDIRGRTHGFVTSFSGVVRDGHLLRIWGVARDITELTELNARLVREQERLKTYARQLVSAEEKARRSTAVDLHDGIGQTLVGMAMTLDVARQNSPADVFIVDRRGALPHCAKCRNAPAR